MNLEIGNVTIYNFPNSGIFNSLNLKSGTVKGYFLTCKSIFDFAKRMEIISKDPTLNVKLSLSKKLWKI